MRFPRFHLSTAIVMAIVAGLFLGLQFVPRIDEYPDASSAYVIGNAFHMDTTITRKIVAQHYGWPFDACTQFTSVAYGENEGQSYDGLNPPIPSPPRFDSNNYATNYSGVFLNLCAILSIAAIAGIILEIKMREK